MKSLVKLNQNESQKILMTEKQLFYTEVFNRQFDPKIFITLEEFQRGIFDKVFVCKGTYKS